jgi:hypothetical protein
LEYILWLVSSKTNEYHCIFNYFYHSIFSWCEKKKVQKPVVPISSKHSRHTTTTKIPNNIPTITPMKTSYIHLDLKSTASNDLASKLKSARQ